MYDSLDSRLAIVDIAFVFNKRMLFSLYHACGVVGEIRLYRCHADEHHLVLRPITIQLCRTENYSEEMMFIAPSGRDKHARTKPTLPRHQLINPKLRLGVLDLGDAPQPN